MLDGIGDRSFSELGNKTPLQRAKTPMLDNLAAEGSNGLYHATIPGQCLPSEIAHFIIFGFSKDEFPGRGALEALGADIPLGNGSVALLAHLASVSEQNNHIILADGNPRLTTEETHEFFSSIKRYSKHNMSIQFHHVEGKNGILVISGDTSPYITDSDPVNHDFPVLTVKPWQGYEHKQKAVLTAQNLNDYITWTYHVLKKHLLNSIRITEGSEPVNICLTQRAGSLKQISPIHRKYGLRSLSISSSIIYKGLSAYIGMDHILVSEAPTPEEEISYKINTALENLHNYDFIHVHSKAPDKAAHQKDPVKKMKAIESLDRGIKKTSKNLLENEDLLIVVMADHSTPSTGSLIHSGETVPVIFHGKGVRVDDAHYYNEIDASKGALSLMRGHEIMYYILNFLDKSCLTGLRDTPQDLPYWPGGGEPLVI